MPTHVPAKLGDEVLNLARNLADPTAALSVPGVAKTTISGLLSEITRLRDKQESVEAYLHGRTERVTYCSDHPDGHSFRIGEEPFDDIDYITKLISDSVPRVAPDFTV